MGGSLISGHPSRNPERNYQSGLDNSKLLLFSGVGNLYSIYAEENSGAADVFLQFFDKASTGDVTLGVTVPDFTVRVPSGSAWGRDNQEIPFLSFSKGCVVAATSTRTGAGAPASNPTVTMWFQKD